MKRTINKSNWSGEKVTYSYTKNTIKMSGGDTMILKRKKKWIDVLLKDYDGKGKHGKFITIYIMPQDKFWKARTHKYVAEKYGVERSGSNPYDVAVQMFSNLV